MKKLSVIVFLVFLSITQLIAGDFVKNKDGISVYPDAVYSGDIKEVRLIVITQNIIRVRALTHKNLVPDSSLVILPVSYTFNNWKVVASKEQVSLITSTLTAIVNLQTGSVNFLDKSGKKILTEKERSMEPRVFDGQPLYSIKQSFITTQNDAWYGLGQHQDDLVNYKTYQVQLFQNNTEVAVPFLVSRKNYGILWDNASITLVGDVRLYQPLGALKLYAKTGEQGWLTASYSNNKNKPDEIIYERAESSINYEFLNDSRLFLPKEFKPENGIAIWEGDMESAMNGIHKFRFTYAGYAKVWIDGQLVLDRWRQAWNPGSAIADVNFKQGIKRHLKVEWIPDGGESYLSCKWLPPLTKEEENNFSFLSEAGKQLDYYFIYGDNLDRVIAGYRLLTGKAVMMPEWAFGKWQSRERYKTQQEVLDVAAEFRRRKIPLDNIVLDWSYWKEKEWGSQEFDETRFLSPDSMISVLHQKHHLRFMISVWPKFYEGIAAYNEFNSKGWLYKRNIADRQRDWIGQGYVSTFYDAFNPGAQKGFWDLIHTKLYSKGIDAWWMDASEPDILSNVSPQKRKEQMSPTAAGPAALYLNAYPLQNAKGIYEGQRSTDPNKRVFILTRSAFAGSQRFAAATWSGDIASRWHDMKAQISAGINFSLSGIPFWTMDIGGFAVESRYEKPSAEDMEEWRELNTRWYQFGSFVPIFRVHGQYPYREIFNIASETHPAYRSMLYYDKLRYRLLPYIYSLAGAAYHKDGTIMRGLVMDFSNDTAVTNIGDQYMFGPSLLINPVYKYRQRNRDVYLPKGAGWYDLYTGKFYNGGRSLNADAGYERMPVFVKAGAILPFGPDLQYTKEKPADKISLYIYTGADGSFELYEDEGTNYNYENGAFATIPISYKESTKTLIIGNRKGSFKGMLQERRFNIIWITKENARGIDREPAADKTINYTGKSVVIKINP